MIKALKKAKQLKLRPKMQMNEVKLNNFLFKRTKRYQSENGPLNLSSDHFDQSLQLRFKSQVQPINNSPEQTYKFLQSRDKIRFAKNSSTDLTFRILKWSSMKGKVEKNESLNNKSSGKNLQIQPSVQKIRNSVRINYKVQNPMNKSMQLKKFYIKKKDHETEKILQNYKFTQRIVFLEQVQQKKIKQFEIQHNTGKKSFRVHNKQEEQKKILLHHDGSRINIQCRPWSSKSIASVNKI